MKYKIIKKILKTTIIVCLLLAMPVVGILASGQSIGNFLEFPPSSEFVEHAPFSWYAFLSLSIFCLCIIMPVVIQIRIIKPSQQKNKLKINFPWWGIVSILSMILFWIISWSNFTIFSKFKVFVFFFLWLSYIFTINALKYKSTGTCFLTQQTSRFFFLFPVSAIFWWYFEYINEFVQNWYYVGADEYSQMEIFLLSTLSFSTVLPAVSSTCDLLLNTTWIKKNFKKKWRIENPRPKLSALFLLVISCSGLAYISVFPEYLYPIVWISPFLILVSIQILFNEQNILSGIAKAEWSLIISAALAALICGIFWEMWNYYSIPKWKYSIPYVHRFQIFEMPVLGFWGYFPFGLLCIAVAEMTGIVFKENKM